MACLQNNHLSPRREEELISKYFMDYVGDEWINFLCILDLWLLGFAKNTYKHSDTEAISDAFDEGLFVWQYLFTIHLLCTQSRHVAEMTL